MPSSYEHHESVLVSPSPESADGNAENEQEVYEGVLLEYVLAYFLQLNLVLQTLFSICPKIECTKAECEQVHRKYLITKFTGVSLGVVASGLAIAGIALTGGGAAAMAIPFFIASSATGAGNIVTNIVGGFVKRTNNVRLLTCEDLLQDVLKIEGEFSQLDKEAGNLTLELFRKSTGKTGHWMNGDLLLLRALRHLDHEITGDYLKSLRPGDHLLRRGGIGAAGKDLFGRTLYDHHGIYVGNGLVVDFGSLKLGWRKKANYAVQHTLEEFVGGAPKLFRREYNGLDLDPAETVKTAQLMANDKVVYGEYHLSNRNCEHFATEMKLGEPWSEQSQTASSTGQRARETCTRIPTSLASVAEIAETTVSLVKNAIKAAVTVERGSSAAVAVAAKMVPLVSVIIGSSLTAVDIGLLVRDWRNEPLSVQKIKALQETLEVRLEECLQQHDALATELQRLLS